MHVEVDFFGSTIAGGQLLPDTRDLQPAFKQVGDFFFNREGEICGLDMDIRFMDSYFASSSVDIWRDAGRPTPEQAKRMPDSAFKAAYLPQDGDNSWVEEICRIATGPLCSSQKCVPDAMQLNKHEILLGQAWKSCFRRAWHILIDLCTLAPRLALG